MSEKTYVKMKIDLLFVFRHVLQQNFEKRQKHENLEWDKVKELEDNFLESKLQEFAKKMEINTIGSHELNYLSNKILDELR